MATARSDDLRTLAQRVADALPAEIAEEVAQASGERLHGAGGVVAAPAEAPVHHGLDAAAGRLEHRRHRQGRHCDD